MHSCLLIDRTQLSRMLKYSGKHIVVDTNKISYTCTDIHTSICLHICTCVLGLFTFAVENPILNPVNGLITWHAWVFKHASSSTCLDRNIIAHTNTILYTCACMHTSTCMQIRTCVLGLFTSDSGQAGPAICCWLSVFFAILLRCNFLLSNFCSATCTRDHDQATLPWCRI